MHVSTTCLPSGSGSLSCPWIPQRVLPTQYIYFTSGQLGPPGWFITKAVATAEYQPHNAHSFVRINSGYILVSSSQTAEHHFWWEDYDTTELVQRRPVWVYGFSTWEFALSTTGFCALIPAGEVRWKDRIEKSHFSVPAFVQSVTFWCFLKIKQWHQLASHHIAAVFQWSTTVMDCINPLPSLPVNYRAKLDTSTTFFFLYDENTNGQTVSFPKCDESVYLRWHILMFGLCIEQRPWRGNTF